MDKTPAPSQEKHIYSAEFNPSFQERWKEQRERRLRERHLREVNKEQESNLVAKK